MVSVCLHFIAIGSCLRVSVHRRECSNTLMSTFNRVYRFRRSACGHSASWYLSRLTTTIDWNRRQFQFWKPNWKLIEIAQAEARNGLRILMRVCDGWWHGLKQRACHTIKLSHKDKRTHTDCVQPIESYKFDFFFFFFFSLLSQKRNS